MRVIDFDAKDVSGVTFSADGRYLAVGGKILLVEVHDLSGRDPVAARPISEFRPQLAFHPRLPLLFTAARDFATFAHTPGALSPAVDLLPHAGRFALSPDGTRLIVSGRFDLTRNGHHLRRFDVCDDGRLLFRWESSDGGGLHWGLCWIPGTDRFAVSEWGGLSEHATRITLRDARDKVVAMQPRSGLPTDELVAGPDGTLIAVYRTMLSVWPAADLSRRPRVVRNDNRKHFTGVAFHPSGKYLAATSNDATVKLFDTATWEVARTFTWDIGKMRSIAFSPDGTLAAAGSENGKVVVWDMDV